jgi:hypothetical protein
MRGERTSLRVARMLGSFARRKRDTLANGDTAFQHEGADTHARIGFRS